MRRTVLARAWRMRALAAAIAAIGAPGVAANPSGAQVVQGSASLRQDGNRLTVTTSNGAIIHWDRFSIGTGDTTRFVQPDAASQVLNRVVGSSPSEILGRLESNGRVFLINPNGVAFGRGAQVDVGALVVSTLRLSNDDFAAGRMRFGGSAAENLAAGQIRNEGAIRTASGGTVYLVAPRVENSGLIHTPEGQVLLAAGHRVSIVNPRSPEVAWEIAAPESGAVNLGEIVARQIVLHGQVVRNAGTLQATTAVVGEDGRIVLRAQRKVEQTPSGRMSATGVDAQGRVRGGEIDVQAGEQVSLQGRVEATPAAVPAATSSAVVAAAASSTTGGGRGSVETVAPATVGTTAPVAQADAIRFQAGGPAVTPAGQTPTRTREPPAEAVVAPLSGAESAAGPGLGEAGMVAEATMPAFVVSAPGGPSGVGSPRLPAGAGAMAGTSAPVQRPAPSDPPPHPDPRHAIAGGVAGTGGRVRVLAREIILGEGLVLDASGPASGGTVLIGGEQQGASAGGPNAQFVFMAPGARISADATVDGPGGRVILWADDAARLLGAISARGGERGGDGGFIETSGRRYLEVTRPADASAPRGRSGEWLLDPYDVEIVSPGGDQLDSNDTFTPSSTSTRVSAALIGAALNRGTHVTITTGSDGAQAGNITVNAAVDMDASGKVSSLTLKAAQTGSIAINQPITVNDTAGASLHLRLESGGDVVFGGSGNGSPVLQLGRGTFDATGVAGKVLVQQENAPSIHASEITLRNVTLSGERARLSLSGNTRITGDLTFAQGTLQLQDPASVYRVEGSLIVKDVPGLSRITVSAGGGPEGTRLITESSLQAPSVIAGTLFFDAGLRWSNAGVVRLDGVGTISLGNTSGVSSTRFTNEVTGKLQLAGTGGIVRSDGMLGEAAVVNKGMLSKTGSGSSSISLGAPPPTQGSIFTHEGSVIVEGGRLSIPGGTTDSGGYDVSSGATLRFGGGSRDIGRLTLRDATVEHDGNPLDPPPVLTVTSDFVAAGASVIRGTAGEFVTRGNASVDGSLAFEPLTVGAAPKRWVSQAALSATGTIDMAGSTLRVEDATLLPGGRNRVGVLTVKGRLEVGGSQGQGTLDFDVGGPDNSDRIDISNGSVPGSAALDVRGRILTTRHGGYSPRFGDSIAFIQGPDPDKTHVSFNVTAYGTGLEHFALTFDMGDPLRFVRGGPGVTVFTNALGANEAAHDRAWNQDSNWSAGKPDALTSALIDTRAAYPVLLAGASAAVRDLTLNPASELRIVGDGVLTVEGSSTLHQGAGLIVTSSTARATLKGEVLAADGDLWIADGGTVVLGGATTVGSVSVLERATLRGTGSLTVTGSFTRDPTATIGDTFSSVSLHQVEGVLQPGELKVAGPITLTTASDGLVLIDAPVTATGSNGTITVAASGPLTIDSTSSGKAGLEARGDIRIDALEVALRAGAATDAKAQIISDAKLEITTPGHLRLTGGPGANSDARLGAAELHLDAGKGVFLTGGSVNNVRQGGRAVIEISGAAGSSIQAGEALNLGSETVGGGARILAAGGPFSITAGSMRVRAGSGPDADAEVAAGATLSITTTSGDLVLTGGDGPGNLARVKAPDLTLAIHGNLQVNGGPVTPAGGAALIDHDGAGTFLIETGGMVSIQSAAGGGEARIGLPDGVTADLGLTLRSRGSGIEINGPIRGGSVRIVAENAGDVAIRSLGSVSATGSGDAIIIAAEKAFLNQAGAGAIIAPSGRWLVFADQPPVDYHDLGGLPYGFKRYAQPYASTYREPDPGNGLIYRFAPAVTAAVTATGAVAKTYDGSTAVEAGDLAGLSAQALDGLQPTDSIEVSVVSAAYPQRQAGNYTSLTATVSLGAARDSTGATVYGYALASATAPVSGTFTIDPRVLTVDHAVADSRPYNATTAASLSGGVLKGAVGGDDVSLATPVGSFADRSVGTAKSVTAAYTLAGDDRTNYTLQQPSGLTADITPKALTVKDVTVTPRMYDRTTNATLSGTPALDGVEAGDEVGLDATELSGSFADPNVGTAKPVTLSGLALTGASKANYTLPPGGATAQGSITAKPVNLVSNTATAVTRTYDGTYIATVDTLPALQGVIAGDAVEVNRNTVSGLFLDRNAGSGKSVTFTVTGLTGPSAGNYSLAMNATNGTGTITPRPLSVGGLGALDKTYDGTTFATVVGSPSLQGAVGNDDVSLNASGLSGSFFDRNVGSSKPVSIGGLALTGIDAANYTLGSAIASASILARTLTVSGVSALDKVYDGTTAATLSAGSLSGVIGADQVGLVAGAGSFADRNVGTGKSVSASFGIDGADAGNYVLQQPGALTASITPRPLTVSGLSARDKVYDGTTTATLAGAPALQGAVAGDAVELDAAQLRGAFADRNVGQNKPVTVSGLSITGSSAGNYTLSLDGLGATASITARTLTVTGLSAADRLYDGTTTASVGGRPQLEGAVANDVVTLDVSGLSGRFADRNVGTGKPVSVAGLSLSGADAGNYALTLDGLGLKAGITARPLAVAGLAASDKVYDRTTTAAVAGTPRLEGAIEGDAIELDTSGLRASFADRNVGQSKPVSFAGLSLRGADAGNYALAALPAATASITQRSLDPTGVRAADRLYDGTTAATLTEGGLRGVLDGDAVSLDISGAQASFADRGAGAGKTVTVTGLRLTGVDAGNYRLSEAPPGVTATIDPRPLNPRFTAADRPYDGTTEARVEVADDRLASDRFTIDYSAAFADRHAGANKTVAIASITLRGPDAANYKPPTEARTTATITVRPAATWTAPTSGDWMVAGNWDALPDRGNVAAVAIPSGVQVTYDGSTPVTLSSLTNAGALVLRGPGLEAARLDNLGRLIIGSGASIDLSGRAVSGSGTLANEGTLGLAGSTVTNRLENTGSLRLSGDNTLTSVANAGAAVLQGGTTTLSGAWVQTAGATALATGVGAAARLIAPGGVRIEGGRLAGSGGIVGDLSVISGALAPRASPGAIDVAGALRLGEGSVLDIELGGTTPGSFDTVSASGAVSLAGKLQISSVGGFAPKATDTFGFLNGASVSGLFADVTANGAELAALNLRNMKVGTAQGELSLPAAALIAEDALIAQTLLTGASMLQPGSSVTSTSSTTASPTMVAGATTGAAMSSPRGEAPSAPPLKSGASTTSSSEDPASGASAPGAPASGSGASGSTPADSGTPPPASSPAGAAAGASTGGSADPAAPEPVRRTVLRTLDLPDAAPAETAAANREVTYTRSPSSSGSPSTPGARRSGC